MTMGLNSLVILNGGVGVMVGGLCPIRTGCIRILKCPPCPLHSLMENSYPIDEDFFLKYNDWVLTSVPENELDFLTSRTKNHHH